MSEIFKRTKLLLGEDAMEKLKASRVAVFGIGGVGGHTAEALVRAGIGELHIIDNDTVSPTNRNRQLEALGWITTVPGKGCFVSGLPEYAMEEQKELLRAFDTAAAALLQRGITRQELAERLMKEE